MVRVRCSGFASFAPLRFEAQTGEAFEELGVVGPVLGRIFQNADANAAGDGGYDIPLWIRLLFDGNACTVGAYAAR